MSTPAIIMMLFGLVVTWGGASICLSLAMKKKEDDK
jgi:hypothetical protein